MLHSKKCKMKGMRKLCGRFTLTAPLEDIEHEFQIAETTVDMYPVSSDVNSPQNNHAGLLNSL